MVAGFVAGGGWGHNGKLCQVGPWSGLFGGDYPFINFILNGGDWGKANNQGRPDFTTMNQYGFPSNNTEVVADGGWRTGFFVPASANYSGNWICDWIGTGSVSVPGTIVSTTGARAGSVITGTNCSTTISGIAGVSLQQIALTITGVSNGGFSQLRFYRASDATALAAGQMFTPEFKAACSDFGVIRFLDKTSANGCLNTVWANRKPTSWWSYAAPYYPSSLLTTNLVVAGASAGQYTLALPGFALTDKAQFICRLQANIVSQKTTVTVQPANGPTSFTIQCDSVPSTVVAGMTVANVNRNNALPTMATVASTTSTSITLNLPIDTPTEPQVGDVLSFSPMFSVNGTTATSMVLSSIAALGAVFLPDTLYSEADQAGTWTTFTYDAALNLFIVDSWRFGSPGMNDGWPFEVCVRLCNEINAHPWFPAPLYACDPITDWFTQLATYCLNNLKKGLIPRFEGYNECWNTNQPGAPYGFARMCLVNRPVSGNFDCNNWYGKHMSTMGQAISAVYGNDRTKYHVVCGFQTVATTTKGNSSNGVDTRMNSYYYVNSESGSAAYNWVTHICIAPYWNGIYENTVTEIAYAYGWQYSGSPQTYIDGYLAAGCPTALTANKNSYYIPWYNYAVSYGVGTEGYEGGYNENTIGAQSASISSITLGNPTVLHLSGAENAWDIIYNTFGLSGATTTLSGIGGTTQLNGNQYTILSATATTITINVDSTAFGAFTSGGAAAYDNSGTYIPAFQVATQTNASLVQYELQNIENWRTAGFTWYPQYDLSGSNVWATYYPDIFEPIANAPRIAAVRQFQALYGT